MPNRVQLRLSVAAAELAATPLRGPLSRLAGSIPSQSSSLLCALMFVPPCPRAASRYLAAKPAVISGQALRVQHRFLESRVLRAGQD